MHCLFLGIAKWIMKLWIEEGILSSQNLSLMEQRAKKIEVLSDIDRILNKIAMGDGFSDFTTDQ